MQAEKAVMALNKNKKSTNNNNKNKSIAQSIAGTESKTTFSKGNNGQRIYGSAHCCHLVSE